ncbi:MAG: stage II sporulation protein R [Clostridia bacterium]|nr:stage II sporulation protein R [Clostridia bacterium]
MKQYGIFALVLCALFLLIGLLPVHGESGIYENVLRLHVLANSDSTEDQALKLKVRDAVLSSADCLLTSATSRDDAIRLTCAHLDELKSAAEAAIRDAGRNDSVRIELGEEIYPTRNYEACCFPSGRYTSLRVIIGEGKGQNFWCVLFPPMCVSAATKPSAEDAFISVGLSADQYRIVTETDRPTYRARFRLLEVIEAAFRP